MTVHTPTTATSALHSGLVFKRGNHTSWFGRAPSWSLRRAVLMSNSQLCYYSARGRPALKGQVDLSACTLRDIQILRPECSKRRASSKVSIWRLAIETPGQRCILAAGSEVDMNAWLRAFETLVMQKSTACSQQDTRQSFLRDSVARLSQRDSFRSYRIKSRHAAHSTTRQPLPDEVVA